MAWEIDFLNFIADNIHSGLMDRLMVLITYLGNGGILWIGLTAVMLGFKDTRKAGIASAVSLILMLISVNIIIKPIAGRIRPFEADASLLRAVLISLPKDASFPSGHTAAGFASSVAVLLCRKKLGIIMVILAFLVGISRLYLCVHFPTDVIAGAVIGALLGVVGYCISEYINKKYIDKTP